MIAAAVLVAAAGFVLAVAFTAEPEADVAITGATAAPGEPGETQTIVEEYVPGRGDAVVLQQREVGLDLAPGWALTDFTLNDVAVPDTELDIVPVDRYVFQPGDGKTVEALEPQTNCASATVFRIADGEATATRTERWCFEVL